MAEERRTELAVVGAGPGGYVAALRAAQRGVNVTLIEKDALGGTCLNVGCIPSKALAHAAGVAHCAASASEMGVHADVTVDLAQTTAWKDGVVDRLTSGVEKLCKANGVALVEGRAEFVDERTLRVERPGGSERVAFEHAVVATGSQPTEIPGFAFDGEHVLDSTAALDLDDVPESLVIVGGGYIGMELSTAYAKLGCDVTVVERLDDVLAGYEDDVARAVRRRAADLGVTFRFGERASEWRESGDGVVVTTADGDDERHDYRAEAVVVAVGREPVLDSLNLDAIGLEANADGRLETDARGRTSVESVFAVGDVAPGPMLAHKASAEGRVVAAVVAGEDATLDKRAVSTAVFTDPEVATVGLTEAEAESEGFDPVVGEFPMGASGRALTVGEPDGFVRLVADGERGVVLGAQIVGPEASELVAEVGLALTMDATLADVAATIHTHPTLSEGVMEAAENALGEAIHTLNR